ncbi:MAG: putative dienelactone hydrolase [Arcticibacterium sp.]|jgi:predicted dienelactone hydrolase
MKKQNSFKALFLLAAFLIHPFIQGQGTFVYGDLLPDAPELAVRGEYKIGVRTMTLINKNQIDVLNTKDGVDPTYDRDFKVEVWYPATLKEGEKDLVSYNEMMGSGNDPKRPLIPFTFQGRAARDADAVSSAGSFPLVIVSHGYVGTRYIMSYLCENLASKGYVVVAIDHKESTFIDGAGFHSTLLNRPKDVKFVLNEMEAFGNKDTFLKGLIDASNTAIIGYSMGGYGVLNVAGAGYSGMLEKTFKAISGGSSAVSSLIYENEAYRKTVDPRIKAVVAFAPWGMERGAWDSTSLRGLQVPTFFIVGSQDDISGYEKGVKAIFEGAVNAERYLLTYANARHNVASNPAPPESLEPGLHFDEYYRYAEPSWDKRRMNNINNHFLTAFLGTKLKGINYKKFLDIPEDSNKKTWEGFQNRSSTGLELRHDSGSK